MFPYYDEMSDDDLFGLPFISRRDRSGDDEDNCNLDNRHLFTHGSKGGKKIEDDDTQPLLLPASKKEEIVIPNPTTGKPREPTEVEVVDIEVKEEEKPKEILVDLNK